MKRLYSIWQLADYLSDEIEDQRQDAERIRYHAEVITAMAVAEVK